MMQGHARAKVELVDRHQVATLTEAQLIRRLNPNPGILILSYRAMARAKVKLVDRQLACMPIDSPEGRDYLAAMKAAANFAFNNR